MKPAELPIKTTEASVFSGVGCSMLHYCCSFTSKRTKLGMVENILKFRTFQFCSNLPATTSSLEKNRVGMFVH